MTTAVREMADDPKVGRAEPMRRSMLSLVDEGTLEEAHPAYWRRSFWGGGCSGEVVELCRGLP
jgi:hypothetical protein